MSPSLVLWFWFGGQSPPSGIVYLYLNAVDGLPSPNVAANRFSLTPVAANLRRSLCWSGVNILVNTMSFKLVTSVIRD